MSEKLFSYGTLQDEKVQHAIFGTTLVGARDAILGFRLKPVTITNPEAIAISGSSAHTILEPGEGDPVEGTVFELSPAQLAQADAYESAEYKRIRVRLRSGAEAWMYVEA